MKDLNEFKCQEAPPRSGNYTAVCLIILFLGWLFPSGASFAQADAYSIEVAVFDRTVEEQQNAYQAAFRRILINNSGDKTLLNRDAVRAGLKQAEDYVASFSYRTPPPGTVISRDTPITDRVRETGEATQLMLVSFDRNLVRELIDSSARGGKAVVSEAPASRQTDSSLVWLLIQDAGRDIMISDPAATNVQSRAREIAGAAGISLVFPVGDSADQQAVTVDDIISQDLERIAAGASRYEQNTILIGNLDRNSARGWRGQWVLLQGDQNQSVTLETPSLDESLQQGLALLGSGSGLDDSYRYGGTAQSGAEGLVWIDSINSLEDYASVMRLLESLPSVATVYPKEVNTTSMVFAVLPRSALRDIESAAVIENRLRRTIAPSASGLSASLAGQADLALVYSQ